MISLGRLEKIEFPYLKELDASVQKLEDFIGEVLDHSRTNRKEIQLEEVDIKELILGITDNLKYIENYSTINFIQNIDEQFIRTDKFLLKVILSNLLSNAIKYQKKRTEEECEIKIKSWRQVGTVCVQISDNGEGIAPSYRDKIFEMFYRGTTNSTGSGLGLFIAKEAAEKLQGAIEFTSEYGVGSVFTVSIPD